ncbi:Uncharacterized protein Adt_03675 [Abeliophyllum distichum]|uniref:DUF4218 domain-containing protein n=1 Tax=Abeliophyllum distichum TaxID=126358 RepID=A0ABD1VZ61_9LAMI
MQGHNEGLVTEDEMADVLNDVVRDDSTAAASNLGYDALFDALHSELYAGVSSFSSLNFLTKLMHLKVVNKWTNKSVDGLLKLLKSAFPKINLVDSHYEAKKLMSKLGLEYKCIHVCRNDCTLFWKENVDKEICPVCYESRWVQIAGKSPGKNVPHKVLRYFPLTPRLKHLFATTHTVRLMRWHNTGRSKDEDDMGHPVDGKAWRSFEKNHPDFACEIINIPLGLSSDGFNPFGNMSQSYSMWPVVLATYNLPPWLCMKEENLMLTLLIPGLQSPGKDMDVFLRPLVDELKELWTSGIDTRDVSSNNYLFRMRAALLWTVSDFSARSSLSGWSGQGYDACPTCDEDTPSMRVIGKHPSYGGVKRKRDKDEQNWRKKSIFYELPYWSTNEFKHNLDVMHVEKNVCDSLLGTLLGDPHKSKDTDKARSDLIKLNIRHELHLYEDKERLMKPAAEYTFIDADHQKFCNFIRKVKFPDGFASNLRKNVAPNESRIIGLKSHDCHILMQRLLLIGCRAFLNKTISSTITELCTFFKKLCARSIKVSDMVNAQQQLILILCKLERIFPPAFFDIMIHLVMHLPEEAILGGPVYMRWMYPFERYFKKLKDYVRNQSKPEGSITEGYVIEEALTFCSRYFEDVDTRFNRPERNDDLCIRKKQLSIFESQCRPIGKRSLVVLESDVQAQAEFYILNNCLEIETYLNEHKDQLQTRGVTNVNQLHRIDFPAWFHTKIYALHRINAEDVSPELLSLAFQTNVVVHSYPACIINGVRFLTYDRDIRYHITMQRVDNDAIQLDRPAKRASSSNVSGDEYNFINDDEDNNEDEDDNNEGNDGGEFEVSDTETDCPVSNMTMMLIEVMIVTMSDQTTLCNLVLCYLV